MAILLVLSFTFLLLLTVHAVTLKDGTVIPTYAKVCRRSQPDLNKCLRNSIQTLIKKISKVGIEQLNLHALDPWEANEFKFHYNGNPNFRISITVTDLNTTGFTTLKIREVRANFDNPRKNILDVGIHNELIYVEGDYFVDGYFYGAPIAISGDFDTFLYNVSGPMKMSGPLVEKDGDKYFQIDHSLLRPEVGDMKIRVGVGSNRYPQLVKLFEIFLNRFWRPIHKEILPYTEEFLDKLWTPYINTAFMKIPFDDIFPK